MAGILIVEDEYIVAMDIQSSLEKNGFTVVGQANRGEQAIQKASELQPELILMDIGLKGRMDGIETAIEIKKQFNLPVIFLTAFGNPFVIERARLAEPFGYIFKPYEERELVSNIKMALYKHEMEKKLRESEDKFRSVIEHSSDGIVLADSHGNLFEWNRAAEQISGLNRSEVIGEPLSEVIFRMLPHEQRSFALHEALIFRWNRVVESEYTDPLDRLDEIEIETPQGVRRVVQSSCFATKTAQETLAGAIIRDVTERRQAEEKSIQFLNVLEASLNEIYIFDPQTLKFEYVNEGARRNLGYSMETLLSRSPIDLKPEFTEASFREMIAPLFLHQQEKLIIQTVHCRADGSLYPVEVHLQLVERGGRALFLAIINDITERRKADAELQKLSQAVEQSANAIVITDIDGHIEYANPKFVTVSGYSLPEVLGKTPSILKSNEHSPEFYQNLWQTIKSGKVWRGELHNRRKDGTLYWEDCTITPVFDPSQRLVNFIAVKEDITTRKMLEEAERNQRQLAEALRDTSAALNGTLKLEEVLDRVLDNIGKLMAFDAAMVLLVDGHSVRQIRYRSRNLQDPINQNIIDDTQANLINIPILQEMRETRLPCLIADTQMDTRWRAIPGMGWIHSFVSAPIVIRGHVAGLINILSDIPGFFTAGHSDRLMVFSGQAAVAIENAQLFEQAYYLSVTDPLTELTNRRHFFEMARIEFERALRYQRTLSVMMVDVDHFKNINDTFGHAVGDLTLREIAARIRYIVRTIDIVARFGGEEFIILMPETSLDEACQVADRVRHGVSDIPIEIEKEAGKVGTTLSIGVAELSETSTDIDDLIRCADQALYVAKADGRNRVVGYQDA